MSGSDSDIAPARSSKVSDARLVAALRDAVQQAQEDEQLTVNSVRSRVEGDLGLKPGFFRDPKWKERSAKIIRGEEEPEAERPSHSEPDKSRGTKRKAPEQSKAAKKRGGKVEKRHTSKQSTLSSLSDDADSDIQSKGKPASRQRAQASVSAAAETGSESPLSEVESGDPPSPQKTDSKDKSGGDDASESELSVLIDDDPPPKKRAKKEPEPKTKQKAAKGRAGKKGETEPSDPDKEEIKKLQGWLVKCGIRKLWGKELSPFDGGKAKIRHLKQMLSEAGMTGRFSLEKARQIKESRELAADLEAVQEGNKLWGTEAADEGSKNDSASEEKPRRRLAKGLQELAFLSSGGEDDSD